MEIVVADDDFVIRRMLVKMLRDAGHQPLEAEEGNQAWAILKERKARMLITDWMMPGMDGPELCRTIRAAQLWGYVFIFLLTSKGDKESIIEGLKAGADDYLTKPFNPAELYARLNTGIRILDLETSLQNANEEIRLLSLTDSLTGCYNKRYLSSQLAKEIRRAQRCEHGLSLIMCDIDHFKRVNDTYGHLTGDQVLKAFTDRVRGSIRRDVDWVARYGGEEFVVVLPETELGDAAVVAEKLRALTAGSAFSAGERQLTVTASFGCAGFARSEVEPKTLALELLRQADEYLYAAKDGGRNQVRHPLPGKPAGGTTGQRKNG